MNSKNASVYHYTDFREYLLSWKKFNPKFSYQFFAKEAGYKSKSFVYLVFSGKKDLSTEATLRFSKALNHDKKESQYFEALVNFTQAKTVGNKNHYYEMLRKMAPPKRVAFLQTDQFDFFKHWYVAPIRELITMKSFDDNWSALARKLDPPIKASEAKKAVELLLKMGLIQKENKNYVQTEKALHTGSAVRSLAVSQFQMQTMDLAKRSLDQHSPEVRDISSLTFGINQKGVELFYQKMSEFRQEIASMAGDYENDMDRVYQLNLQLFPLSKIPK